MPDVLCQRSITNNVGRAYDGGYQPDIAMNVFISSATKSVNDPVSQLVPHIGVMRRRLDSPGG